MSGRYPPIIRSTKGNFRRETDPQTYARTAMLRPMPQDPLTFDHLTIEQLTRELPPVTERTEPLLEMDPTPTPKGLVRKQAVKGTAGSPDESSRARRSALDQWVDAWRRAHPEVEVRSVQYGDWPDRSISAVFLFTE